MHFINLTFRMLVNIQFLGLQRFYIVKTKRRRHDRKTEQFKALSKHDHFSPNADRVQVSIRLTALKFIVMGAP